MSETSNKKKKIATAVTATLLTAAILLSGTYAWQNLNQEALNVAASEVNPGGRLHDDFNGTNKDIYVENFAEQQIFARVQLTEYMEIGQDAGKNLGTEGRQVEVVTTGANYNDKSTWSTHKFVDEDATSSYWTWTTGGQTTYMPTFNMNKDSLKAEINGTFEGPDGADGVTDGDQIDRYKDYVTYTEGQTITGAEIYDIDTNSDDEGESAVEGTNIKTIEDQTHTAKSTGSGTLISMAEWKALPEDQKIGTYWVYDADGWVYWAEPIEPGTATGLLLDEINLTGAVGDNWYYATNIVAQFITADDLGKNDNTGFYDTAKGTMPSDDALTLLETIGVNIPVEPDSIDDWEYSTNDDGTLTITAYKGSNTEVVIPSSINGTAVTAISGMPRQDGDVSTYNSLWHTDITEEGASPDGYSIDAAQNTITSVTVSEGIESIDSSFFMSTALTEVNLPSTLTSIGDFSFYSCANLNSIVIPANVTSIGSLVFSNCSNLTNVYCEGSKETTSTGYMWVESEEIVTWDYSE